MVTLLPDHDAPVDAPTADGSTALQGASFNNHLPIGRLLVARGAVVNRPRNTGGTTLHGASRNGHVAVVQYLISQGALPDAATVK